MEIEPQSRESNSFLAPFLVGAAVVLLLVGAVLIYSRATRSKGPAAEQHLPFGAAEQAYAKRVHFLEPHMARASNFLNQDVTYISGVLSNDGDKTVREAEITLEFHDPFEQVVLRETRRIVGANGHPIGGGERRDFQISLDYVPEEWNQTYPRISVTGLQME